MNQQEAFIGFAVYGVISSLIGFFTFFLLSKMQSTNKHCGLWSLLCLVSSRLVFIYWSGGHGPELLVWIPLVTLMSIYNVHSLKFCGLVEN